MRRHPRQPIRRPSLANQTSTPRRSGTHPRQSDICFILGVDLKPPPLGSIYAAYAEGDLLQLLRSDDPQAFAELYERYRLDVYRYGLTIVKVPQQAEDLLQDTFIRLWDVRHRLEIKTGIRQYLLRICHNRAIDINKQVAVNRQLVDQLFNHYQDDSASLECSLVDLQRYDALVEEALSSLSPQRRRVYEMCKKEKKSYEEVARELQLSTNTVKAHMTQANALLREYIRKNARISILVLLLGKFF